MPTDTQHSHSNEQQQMDAVVIQASGPPAQSLAYRSEPVPEPGPEEVLVEVHAAAVNPLDVANALGLLALRLCISPARAARQPDIAARLRRRPRRHRTVQRVLASLPSLDLDRAERVTHHWRPGTLRR
ncbi:MAG: hypothetical protein JWL68_339 [Actinomycetia bacterium]|nr:hypothetical protein [Actinomycetes bacterium]